MFSAREVALPGDAGWWLELSLAASPGVPWPANVVPHFWSDPAALAAQKAWERIAAFGSPVLELPGVGGVRTPKHAADPRTPPGEERPSGGVRRTHGRVDQI